MNNFMINEYPIGRILYLFKDILSGKKKYGFICTPPIKPEGGEYSFTNVQVQKTKIIAAISTDGYVRVIIKPKTIQY